MGEANFLMVGENIDEKYLDVIDENDISAYYGRDSGKLYGFKIVTKAGKKCDIWLSDIERMKDILDKMTGDYVVKPISEEELKAMKEFKFNENVKVTVG